MPHKPVHKSNALNLQVRAKALMGLGFKAAPLKPATRGFAKPGKAPMTAHGAKDATGLIPCKPVKKSNAPPSNMIRAKALIDLGFSIVPLNPATRGLDKSGKTPMTAHGVKDATGDFSTFKKLLGNATDFNIGVATGSASGVTVIDIDPRNQGLEEFKKLIKQIGPLPNTLVCETGGGGRHYYFLLTAEGTKSGKLAPGVDLLAQGSYAVAPPSQHASGKRYHWLGSHGLEVEIAALPDSWLQFIKSKAQQKKETISTGTVAISEGSRNVELTRIAGQMRRNGLSESAMLAALRVMNKERCEPPLGDAEFAQIARNVAQFPVGPETRDEGQKVAQALLDAEFSGGQWLRHESDGQFWAWKQTHWAVISDKMLQQKILNIVVAKFPSAKPSKTLCNEVFGLLQIMRASDDDLLHFASEPPPVVNVTNCELWLKADGGFEARPHSAATGMRHVLNVAHDPDATCPDYAKAIGSVFAKAQYPKTLIEFFEELLGYAIQPRRDIALIVLMIGGGSNGKSSLVRLLMELVGTHLVHSGRVDELEEARFAIGNLFGKLLFIDDDVRAGAKLPDGILKKISEAKQLTGEYKFKQAFTFVNRAFPILLCNNAPSLADLTHGMIRRLHVLPFDRSFADSEIDRTLFDRIIKNELSGVLNRALEGWKRWRARGKFRQSQDMSAALERLLIHANPLKGFISERYEADAKSKVTLEVLYDDYRRWAHENGYSMTQTKTTVKANLQHLKYTITRHGPGLVVIGLKPRAPLR